MQTSTPIIDLHIHSTLKPYGNSFYPNNDRTVFTNSSCIWFYDYRSRSDLRVEGALGICRYRQSDFKSLADGQVKIACVSLYPIEKEFFNFKEGTFKKYEVVLADFTSMFGKNRINNVKAPGFNYFKDLCEEYEFLSCLDGTQVNGYTYRMMPDASSIDTPVNLQIIPSIEGCHAFCDGNNPSDPAQWKNIKDNVAVVKNWLSPPLFVTLAHHFYNGLCTHARSLFDMSGNLLDQLHGMRDYGHTSYDQLPPISAIGRQMIDLLLKNDNERRILIDVKHMSREARQAYYQILATDYAGQNIPVLCSHGAVALDEALEINLDLDDLDMIYKTHGIIGLEMDQRILGYNDKRFMKTVKGALHPGRESFKDAAYFWRQIVAIAEYSYKKGYTENPWKCIALGSDYDGIINPLNTYPDATSLSVLYNNLIEHLEDYWEQSVKVIPQPEGRDAADVIYEIMYKNAYDFIARHYQV